MFEEMRQAAEDGHKAGLIMEKYGMSETDKQMLITLLKVGSHDKEIN